MHGLNFIVRMKIQIMQVQAITTKVILVALCLDLGLRLRGSSLDALMH